MPMENPLVNVMCTEKKEETTFLLRLPEVNADFLPKFHIF
jgi:hypothetical protein